MIGLALALSASYNKIADKAFVGLQISSLVASTILVSVLAHLRLELIDYGVLIIMTTRCAITFILMSLISAGKPGFENNDIKQLQDSIILVYIITISLVSVNWKLDLLLTTPIVGVAQYVATIKAFSTRNGNMDCFNATADTIGSHLAFRWVEILIIQLTTKYISLKHELNEFVQR